MSIALKRFTDPAHLDFTQRPPWVEVRLAVKARQWPDDEAAPFLKENFGDRWVYYGGGVFRFASEDEALHAIPRFGLHGA